MNSSYNVSFQEKFFISLSLSFLLVISTCPVFAKAPTAKALLWEISGNGLDKNSYLFGTYHQGCANQLALSIEQEKALIKSQQLYTELTYASKQDLGFEGGTGKKSGETAKSKKQFKDVMTPVQYKIIEDYFEKDYLEFIIKDREPNNALFILELTIQNRVGQNFYNKRCKKVTSKENVLVTSARKHGLRLDGIETQEDRSKVLQNVSLEENLEVVLSLINEYQKYQESPESAEKLIAEGLDNYLSQNINAMQLSRGDDNQSKALLEGRNRRWIPRMQNIMKQKPTFFAFGAAHLGGENGVIALLEAKGYRLRPIFDKPIENALASRTRADGGAMTAADYFATGNKKEEEGEILEAIDNYSQAIVLNPQYAQAYEKRAQLKQAKLNDFHGALADLDRAIVLNVKNTELYYSRARLKSEKLKDFRGALSDLNQIVKLNPNDATVYSNRGVLQNEKLNNSQAALLDFNTHILLFPQSVGGHIDRGILKYSKLQDKSGGITDIRRANKLARIQNMSESIERTRNILIVMGVNP
jgi:uncharacterized protein